MLGIEDITEVLVSVERAICQQLAVRAHIAGLRTDSIAAWVVFG